MMLVICDLDGTLAEADPEYVRFIKDNPDTWKDMRDPPSVLESTVVKQVATLIEMIYENGGRVIIVTARPDTLKSETVRWLIDNNISFNDIYFRSEFDTRSDCEVKQDILALIRKEHGEPTMAFEDRKSVIDMWINNGIYVFDVSQGQGDF